MKKDTKIYFKGNFKLNLLMVVLIIGLFFLFSLEPQPPTRKPVEKAWYKGCEILKNVYDCNPDKVAEVNTGIDVNGDGLSDNLLFVCRLIFHFHNASKYFCRNLCCGVNSSSPCKEDKDCLHPSTWFCNSETHKCEQK